MSDYEILLEEFFDLKTKYEEEYRRKKASIINKRDLSTKRKRKMIETIKIKCIGCKRPVGTVFYDKDRTYGATCGSKDSPCSLNIHIKKQSVFNIKDMLPSFETEIDNSEFNIKKMKLYLLFGLITEDQLIKLYEEEKEEYNTNTDFKERLIEILESQTNIEHREEQIKLLTQELHEEIKEVKENMKDYLVNQNQEGLTNAVEIYNDNIVNIIRKLRANKYSSQTIEEEVIKMDEMAKINIRNLVNTIDEYEMIVEDAEIIHFEK